MKRIIGFFIALVVIMPAFAQETADAIVAVTKKYVDSGLEKKANTDDIKPVAFSGSYNDLVDKPVIQNPPAPAYSIRANSLSNAATGGEVSVTMDGFTFKAVKVSRVNYWGLRLINNTGAPVTIGNTFSHFYGGLQNLNNEYINIADGGSYNPESADDIGYGKEDTAINHVFDTTNMHLYRWTTTVYANNAIVVVEKLY